MFENVYGRTDGQTDGRRLDSHPISSPCEPSAQVSLNAEKLRVCLLLDPPWFNWKFSLALARSVGI